MGGGVDRSANYEVGVVVECVSWVRDAGDTVIRCRGDRYRECLDFVGLKLNTGLYNEWFTNFRSGFISCFQMHREHWKIQNDLTHV